MCPWVSSTAAGVSRFLSRMRRSVPIAPWPGSTMTASVPGRSAST
ncbi:Uncharacterised protein [Mycobacterium tuberculosis]|nr:Uncharacterised protein [Mycobacterium tuberculosis]COZ46315.1 Uncharacterised protein [Mycobacterium tuberculosis]